MPCITTTCDTGALTVLSKSFSTRDRQETVWLCAVSSCLTVAPRFLFFFAMKKKKYDDRHKKTQTAPANDLRSETKPAEPKAAARGTSSGLFVLYLTTWVVCTEAACDRDRVRSSPINFFSFCFCFCKKNCKHARARPKKRKKKKEGSSTEVKKERPKHLQVLIQLGL